jgi:formate hydrogenlyase transcriptional activator
MNRECFAAVNDVKVPTLPTLPIYPKHPHKLDFIHFPIKDDFSLGFEFEQLISEITACLLHVQTSEFDCVVEDCFQKLLDFFLMDSIALFQTDDNGNQSFHVTHAKTRPGCGFRPGPVLTRKAFPFLIEECLKGRQAQFSRITDLPAEAAVDKRSLHELGLRHSSMAIPLFEEHRLIGILTLMMARDVTWLPQLAPRLMVLGYVFSAALSRRKIESKLYETLQELEQTKKRLHENDIPAYKMPVARNSSGKVIYKSRIMSEVLSRAGQVAATNASVLLCGETGTGKELIASFIHEMSPRSSKTMVRVNCGAIPTALVESEMFGREKGAYTGALSRQIGRFELAHESTIFLDEITSLPAEVQVKLLRVLQEKEIERLGNPKPILVDVRIIAATNQNPEDALKQGKFRSDLYYRLNVFPIEVPPLRERRDDIPLLAWHFVDQLSLEFGKKVESISSSSMDALLEYSWPGNVRELRNTIERAMIASKSRILQIDLPQHALSKSNCATITLKELELQHILKVLEETKWKIRGKRGAAEILGLKPTTLETRMAKLGIVRPH